MPLAGSNCPGLLHELGYSTSRPHRLIVARAMVLLKNIYPPTEGVRCEQPETIALMDGEKLGCGTLYVAET